MPPHGHPGQLCPGARRQQQPPQPGHRQTVVRARARQRVGQSHRLCPRPRSRGGDGRSQTLSGSRRHFGRFAQDPAPRTAQPRAADAGGDCPLQAVYRQRAVGADGGPSEHSRARRLGPTGFALAGHHPRPAGRFAAIRGACLHRCPQDERGIDLRQHRLAGHPGRQRHRAQPAAARGPTQSHTRSHRPGKNLAKPHRREMQKGTALQICVGAGPAKVGRPGGADGRLERSPIRGAEPPAQCRSAHPAAQPAPHPPHHASGQIENCGRIGG